jgi:hypothetical protein
MNVEIVNAVRRSSQRGPSQYPGCRLLRPTLPAVKDVVIYVHCIRAGIRERARWPSVDVGSRYIQEWWRFSRAQIHCAIGSCIVQLKILYFNSGTAATGVIYPDNSVRSRPVGSYERTTPVNGDTVSHS